MKNLFLPLLVVVSLTCFSQTKKSTRYFYYTCTFQSTDGCHHDQFGKFVNYHGTNAYGYDAIYSQLQKYVRPYKIINGTFQINEYRQIPKKEWLTYKGNKFNPCNKSEYSSIVDTSMRLKHYTFMVTNSDSEILQVNSIDSNKTYTVHFAKSKVKFINDSTFTFKIR